MPSNRPQATFEPFSPNIDVETLVNSSPNFEWVVRVHCDKIEERDQSEFQDLIFKHVIRGGKPLVIEGYESKLDKRIFSPEWLHNSWGNKVFEARDLSTGKNIPLRMQHYLRNMAKLTNQWNEQNYKDDDRQRLYLKDIDCHPLWAAKVRRIIPSGLFYMNEQIDQKDDSTSSNSPRSTVVRAGDLMSALPTDMRAENLMCYIGHEGTYTPAHREMCASLGNNIMVEASATGVEDGKPTRAGSSIWFMTETQDREVVSEYWLSRLGHDIEVEKHFAQINAWKQAPFAVYVVEQKPGDFILIPPLAPHQVWNRGTRTMKVAWNRTTVETLQMALDEALFKARMVCRDEQYKNKAIVYYTLQQYSELLSQVLHMLDARNVQGYDKIQARRVFKDFRKLHSMYTAMLVSETFSEENLDHDIEMVPFDSNITCSYCRCNIFNRFLTCPSCIDELTDGTEDTYDICLDCYAMGRSCRCISGLRWVEQWSWNVLRDNQDKWRKQILKMDSKSSTQSPKSLSAELKALGTQRTLAQICQMELSKRPVHDSGTGDLIPKHQNGMSDVKKARTSKGLEQEKLNNTSTRDLGDTARCHIDRSLEPKWKQACCSKCGERYCFGTLFRAYDEMPQIILANPDWICPSCRKICSCRKCSRKPGFKHYVPKGSLLGHNTKSIADPRSVESLVDFSHANIAWIKKAGDDDDEENTLRLRRKMRDAKAAREEDYQSEDEYGHDIDDLTFPLNREESTMTIDPQLLTNSSTPTDSSGTLCDENFVIEHPEGLHVNAGFGTTSTTRIPIPAGGAMRDEENDYEFTDAITYFYSDTDSPGEARSIYTTRSHLPDSTEPEATSFSRTSTSAEKTVTKRKRSVPSEGDGSYALKKAKSKVGRHQSSTARSTARASAETGDKPGSSMPGFDELTAALDKSLSSRSIGASHGRQLDATRLKTTALHQAVNHFRAGQKPSHVRQPRLSDWDLELSDDDM